MQPDNTNNPNPTQPTAVPGAAPEPMAPVTPQDPANGGAVWQQPETAPAAPVTQEQPASEAPVAEQPVVPTPPATTQG